jgi:hypothetical protein
LVVVRFVLLRNVDDAFVAKILVELERVETTFVVLRFVVVALLVMRLVIVALMKVEVAVLVAMMLPTMVVPYRVVLARVAEDVEVILPSVVLPVVERRLVAIMFVAFNVVAVRLVIVALVPSMFDEEARDDTRLVSDRFVPVALVKVRLARSDSPVMFNVDAESPENVDVPVDDVIGPEKVEVAVEVEIRLPVIRRP